MMGVWLSSPAPHQEIPLMGASTASYDTTKQKLKETEEVTVIV